MQLICYKYFITAIITKLRYGVTISLLTEELIQLSGRQGFFPYNCKHGKYRNKENHAPKIWASALPTCLLLHQPGILSQHLNLSIYISAIKTH